MLAGLRFVMAAIWLIFVSVAGMIYSLFNPFSPNNNYRASRLLTFLPKIMGVKVTGIVPKDLPHQAVIISNHQSNWDILVGPLALPENTVTIGKKDLLYIPFFGLYYWLTGNILINRQNKKAAYSVMDQVANQIKNKKMRVWIMPEGTRSQGRGLMPFKKGAFYVAKKINAPIIPIAISAYHGSLNFNRWQAGVIRFTVLPAIETTHKSIEELVEQSFAEIKANL